VSGRYLLVLLPKKILAGLYFGGIFFPSDRDTPLIARLAQRSSEGLSIPRSSVRFRLPAVLCVCVCV